MKPIRIIKVNIYNLLKYFSAATTAAVDRHLDETKYIVPGLGDFGDRYFGT